MVLHLSQVYKYFFERKFNSKVVVLLNFLIKKCTLLILYRLILVRQKKIKVNLFACMCLLMGRNLFLLHSTQRSCPSNNLTWFLIETLKYHTTGKMAVSSSMDTWHQIQLMNILYICLFFSVSVLRSLVSTKSCLACYILDCVFFCAH